MVEVALTRSSTSLVALKNFEEYLQALALELEKCVKRMDTSTHSLMSLVNRVSSSSSERTMALEHSIQALEGDGPRGRHVHRGSVRAEDVEAVLTADTLFGTAQVGLTAIDLTMNTLLSHLQSLSARLQMVADRSQNSGVIFHRLSFTSEVEFGYWYLANNPQGKGPAAFVDIISIWAFALSELGATEWLVDLHRLQLVGFKASPDTLYAHLMTTRYPWAFVGKIDSILSSQTIKMLESVDA